MKLWRWIPLLMSAGLLAAACSPLQPTLSPVATQPVLQESPPAILTPAIPETAAVTQGVKLPLTLKGTPQLSADYPAAVQAAIQDLATRLQIESDQISVKEFHEETWTDGCLGLGRPDESCLQVLTPGFRVLLEAGSASYEYHTDATGQLLRLAGDAQIGPLKPGLDVQRPLAILMAMRALNQATGVPVAEIQLVSAAAARWSDSCLGLANPGENCAEVITDGWIILLDAAGQRYEFHTDQLGAAVRQRQP